jgi:hypothetical protein
MGIDSGRLTIDASIRLMDFVAYAASLHESLLYQKAGEKNARPHSIRSAPSRPPAAFLRRRALRLIPVFFGFKAPDATPSQNPRQEDADMHLAFRYRPKTTTIHKALRRKVGIRIKHAQF